MASRRLATGRGLLSFFSREVSVGRWQFESSDARLLCSRNDFDVERCFLELTDIYMLRRILEVILFSLVSY
ncbi:hypothetical protein L6164_017636 [Bauhinia variegata]|uniref:Uncharacterized protein n=1 Tax=Bauhinia variegata TaxID=167791 RepID=A0ACB9NAF2_BAUVA|nr:hypothetical protein L6164_017636 [Bauhinia variegata]